MIESSLKQVLTDGRILNKNSTFRNKTLLPFNVILGFILTHEYKSRLCHCPVRHVLSVSSFPALAEFCGVITVISVAV